MLLLMDIGEWIELLTDIGAMGEGYIQEKSSRACRSVLLRLLVTITCNNAHGFQHSVTDIKVSIITALEI